MEARIKRYQDKQVSFNYFENASVSWETLTDFKDGFANDVTNDTVKLSCDFRYCLQSLRDAWKCFPFAENVQQSHKEKNSTWIFAWTSRQFILIVNLLCIINIEWNEKINHVDFMSLLVSSLINVNVSINGDLLNVSRLSVP